MRAPAWTAPFAILVASAVHAADAPPPTALSPADRDALLTAACSWSEGTRAELSKQRCAAPSDLVWSSARTGRFVEGPGEWLVSLGGPCIGGCPGVTFVARKAAGRWTKLAADENLVTDGCVTVHGLADGWDRVACLGAAGPNQGFMAEWLELRTYADDLPARQLLYKEHGGECFLAEPPAKAEYDGDDLSDLSAGAAGSDVALTIRLTVRRAACDRTVEDPEKRATVRGEHVLRFVKRGNDVVLDGPTAALVTKQGWLPER